MAVLILVFAIAIGFATFLENEYGTAASKGYIYNTYWFEALLLVLTINLIGNIFKYKMLSIKKLSVLTFHVAFIIIIIGAGITRYIGYEGGLRIREGQMNNKMVSESVYFNYIVHDDKDQRIPKFSAPVFFSEFMTPSYSRSFDFKGKDIDIEVTGFTTNALLKPVKSDKEGAKIIEFVRAGDEGRVSEYLEYGKTINIGGLIFTFDSGVEGAVNVTEKDGRLYMQSPFEINYMTMAKVKVGDRTIDTLRSDTLNTLEAGRLHTCSGVNFVLKDYFKNANMAFVKAEKENQGKDVVNVHLKCGEEEKDVAIFGGKGIVYRPSDFQCGGLTFQLSYGSKHVELPFNIQLDDFQLERYPGSQSPASFASQVTLIDAKKKVSFPFRIYMNNILDYDGYRLFQSSYDKDELGTVLSVNHDFWGTYVTYLGYSLLTLGFILTLFMRNTRFHSLRMKIKELQVKKEALMLILIPFALLSVNSAQGHAEHGDSLSVESKIVTIDRDHAEKFGRIVVQDQGGRMKPFHTVCSEICRKVTGAPKYEGLVPTQMILSMLYQPVYWQTKKMIKVKNPDLKKELGITGKHASLLDFFSERMEYRLAAAVEEANRKKPGVRNKYDKDVIEVDERVNICYMVYSHSIFKMFPRSKDINNVWDAPSQPQPTRNAVDSLWVSRFFDFYIETVSQSIKEEKWDAADSTITFLKRYQNKHADPAIMPSSKKIELEIGYNKQNIFIQVYRMYGVLGILLLFLLFGQIFQGTNFFGSKINKLIFQCVASLLIFAPIILMSESKLWFSSLFAIALALSFSGFMMASLFEKIRRTTAKGLTWIVIGLLVVTALYHLYGLSVRWYISGHAPWSNGYEAMTYIAFATMVSGFIFLRNSRITLAATAILAALILWVASLNFMNPTITNLVPVLDSYWLMIHVAIITASYGFLGLACILALINVCLMLFKTVDNAERINLTLKETSYVNEMTITVGLFMLTIGTFLGGVWANESWGRYWGWDPKETWAMVSVLVYAFVSHMRLVPGLRGIFTFNFAALWAYSSIIMTYFGVNYYLSGLHSYAKGDPAPFPDWATYTIIAMMILTLASYLRNRSVEKKLEKLKK